MPLLPPERHLVPNLAPLITSFLHMKYFLLIILGLWSLSCNTAGDNQQTDKAQKIIQQAIEAHGGDLYEASDISFTFRKRSYTARREGGTYTYTREFDDTLGQVTDILDNSGFTRLVDGKEVKVGEEMAGRFSQSVNSVWYFALLPFPLADPAVNLEYAGTSRVEGKTYDVVQVTFDQESGGEDFEDTFMYWFDPENSHIDYLAYSYATEGGGVRFRKAFNRREVGGIIFADYHNYKPENKNTSLAVLDSLYEAGQLEKVSEIVLENVEVEPITGG